MKQTIKVYQDGELIQDPLVVRATEALQDALTAAVSKMVAYVVLQAKMALYDAIHGTNYRKTRNKIYRQERNRRFESSIGLVRC